MSGSDRIRAWEYGSYSGDPQGVGEWYTIKIVVNNYVSFNYERCNLYCTICRSFEPHYVTSSATTCRCRKCGGFTPHQF